MAMSIRVFRAICLLWFVCLSLGQDEKTSQASQLEAEVRAGSTAQILPTRASEANQLPAIQATIRNDKNSEEKKGDTESKKDNIKEISYEPTVEEHFSYTNDLKEGYLELSPTKAGPGNFGAILRTASGEGSGGPRGKVGGPTAGRKSSPDIQEIITGFVKLLNGNTPAVPPRPVRTRINNRGPPRITDLPPLVLDPPRRDPPPYPFERPQGVIKPFVSGVPLPEQIVPTEPQPMRPPLRPVRNKTQVIQPTRLPITPQVLGTAVSSSVQEAPANLSKADNYTKTTKPPTTNATTTSPPPIVNRSTTTNPPTTTTNRTTTTTNRPPTTTTNRTTTMAPPTTTAPKTTTTTTRTTTPKAEIKTPPMTIKTPSELEKKKKIVVSPSTTIEPSIVEVVTVEETKWNDTRTKATGGYAPRPGIVLDDPEYKPGIGKRPTVIETHGGGQVFDITVSAVQGPDQPSKTGQPVIYPGTAERIELEGVSLPGAGNGEVSVITSAEAGQHFVSIDGKRTYISLFGSSEAPAIKPTPVQRPQMKTTQGTYTGTRVKRPPQTGRRPQQPAVRIDTCIVGDWSTCDSEQHETCRTEQGVSSCHCSPGYSRRSHRQPCKRVVSLVTSVQVDKFYDQKVTWSEKLKDPDSQEYLQLEYEAIRAMESAMSMTPFSDAYMGAKVNGIYTHPGSAQRPVFVNVTLQVEENAENLRPQVRGEIQRHLLGAIHRRGNNIGTSHLWAPTTNGVSHLQDLDECSSPDLNDCHNAATCRNTFGSFECTCPPGYKDEFSTTSHKSGRRCETCGPEFCNHRGTCSYSNAQPVCQCSGNYYGSQCEVDGEVLGVAIGASVAAVIIILSTLACLCMWSRRWNKEEKVGMGSPVFGYMPSGGSSVKTPGIGAPPYQVSLEDRMRWAQIADVMAHSTNHYAVGPEPVNIPTRPSSAMFGYGGTLPVAPMPLPRLGLRSGQNTTRQDSSSEEEDRADLLGRSFQVPRPKSRSSVANQSGIYYDVDYEQQQGDHFTTTKSHPGCIALNTYTLGRAHYYRT
ncbi:uncharacterized protein [Halyomorpha halys]|uniref:uncharacterized protein isoform X1 n=1 Tax=Halyomorpha halys TaxID=286706 RepID=UPI0006D51F89|nr:uncharacterized protein LOC106687458 isoform X1 [Halyomorpha halys]